MYTEIIQLIKKQADADLCATFHSWSRKIQYNPGGQLCPDAYDIRLLMEELIEVEKTANKADVAVGNLFHRTQIRDTRRAVEERAYAAKLDAEMKADALRDLADRTADALRKREKPNLLD
jgi:hypothetical protein